MPSSRIAATSWTAKTAAVVTLLLAVGCAGDERDSKQQDRAAQPIEEPDDAEYILAHAEYAFPDETLEDWVSYTDQLSEIEVIAEAAGRLEGEAKAAREGHVSRTITVRIVSTIWWNAEVRPEPEAGELRFGAIGWQRKGDRLVPLIAREAPRLRVGGRYVVPLQWHGKNWTMLTGRCAFAAPDDDIAEADIARTGQGSIAMLLSGKSYSAIHDLLASTMPYEVAAMNWSLPPYERLVAVQMAAVMAP